MSGEQEAIVRHRKTAGGRWVTIKVRHDTKRLLDLISAAEEASIADLVGGMAEQRWQRVKDSDMLP